MKFSITRRSEPTDGRWHAPDFSMPMAISESDLEILGADLQGREWFKHRLRGDYGELRAGPVFGASADLPNELLIKQTDADGVVTWRSFTCHEPGTLEKLRHPVARRATKPDAPRRPVDALDFAYLAGPRPERIIAPPTAKTSFGADLVGAGSDRFRRSPYIRLAEPAARGPEAIRERIRKAGSECVLAADGQHWYLVSKGGRPGPGVVELAERANRLILAALQGNPLRCEIGSHDALATTELLGGAAACESCAAGSVATTESEVA